MTDTIRACTKCGTEKPDTIEFFMRHRARHGRLYAQCRDCSKAELRAYRKKNAERINGKRRQQYADQNGAGHRSLEIARAKKFPFRSSAEMLVRGVRNRSKSRGHAVAAELTNKQFVEAWLRRQPKCECCDIQFELGRRGAGHTNSGSSPSFDRFDLSIGYTLENTALICWGCNAIKKNYSSTDLRCVADWIDRRKNRAASTKRSEAA